MDTFRFGRKLSLPSTIQEVPDFEHRRLSRNPVAIRRLHQTNRQPDRSLNLF
jgi:hypothetical protein